MKIGIKYCGGCNPRYDRTAIVTRLEHDLSDVQIGLAGGEKPDYVVVLCGCSSACALHANLTGRHGKSVLTRGEDYAPLLEALRGIVS
jgi:hypothetical protein